MRYKILYLHPIVLISICQHGTEHVKVINGLPLDTKYIRSFVNDASGWGRVGVVIESSSFEELKDGDEIPVINPEPVFEKV